MGEVQYVWADPANPQQQVALSSVVRAMKGKEDDPKEQELFAIARWVTRDGADPKMGVLAPTVFERVDCLLWTHVKSIPPPLYTFLTVLFFFSDALRG